MSDIKITALDVIENQRNPYIINDVIKFKITLDKTVKGHVVSKPFLVFKLNNTISKCALLVTTAEQTKELMFEYTIQHGDLDLIGIKLSREPFSQGLIYYDHPSLKITGLTGEALDTQFSNITLDPAIKIDTRGDPVNYQTNKYLVPIKPGGQTIGSYFSLTDQQRHIKELKIFAKKATINKIEFSSNRKEGSIAPGDTNYYKQGDSISGKIEFTSVWNGNPEAFANGILSNLTNIPKVKLVIQSRTSSIELDCSLSTDKNSLSFNYTVQNNDNDSDGITILTKKSANNDNELDIVSSSSILDIYGNPVYIIVPSTVNLVNMPKYKIKTSITKIKVVDLSNTPDGFTNLDTSNAQYKPHYYTINNKIIIDYYFDSKIYFKTGTTANDMTLRIDTDYPRDGVFINNPIIKLDPETGTSWSWNYNFKTIDLNIVGSRLRFQYQIISQQQSLEYLQLDVLKSGILIDEAGNDLDLTYRYSEDVLLKGKYDQFSLFSETRSRLLLSMFRIDTIPISIEKINVSISNFVPGAENQAETVFNTYTVGTNITFNVTFSREVYIKTLTNDGDKAQLLIK